MVNVLSVVAAHVSNNAAAFELFFMVSGMGLISLGMVLVLAVVVRRIMDAHHWNVSRMRAVPAGGWNRMATVWFETAPDFNDVAYAANPHGCLTVVRPTRRVTKEMEVPELRTDLMRTVAIRRHGRLTSYSN